MAGFFFAVWASCGIIRPMERIDDLQRGGLKIISDTRLFCFGTDAVLLADFAQVRPGERVADLGAGQGILPLLLYARQPDASYHGVEIQEELAGLARRSVELNGLGQRITITHGDLKQAKQLVGTGLDVVVCNPPYEKENDGEARKSDSHRVARKEVLATLAGVCAAAAGCLREGGRFYMIHKASRLADVFHEMQTVSLMPKLLRLVQPHLGDEPRYALVCGAKGGKSHLRLLPTLILLNGDGTETEEVRRIYGRPE